MAKELAGLLNGPDPISVVVTEAWHSCCGKPPTHRVGYEQTYVGRPSVDGENLTLISDGLGTVSYVVVCPLTAVEDAAPLS